MGAPQNLADDYVLDDGHAQAAAAAATAAARAAAASESGAVQMARARQRLEGLVVNAATIATLAPPRTTASASTTAAQSVSRISALVWDRRFHRILYLTTYGAKAAAQRQEFAPASDFRVNDEQLQQRIVKMKWTVAFIGGVDGPGYMGAADREEDEPFRARIKSYWNTARRGTLRAIEQGAIDTPGVASASAAEELTGGSQPARVVKLYVADADGSAGAGLVIDLGEYRAAGIQVVQVMSITQLVDVQLKLTFQAGKDTDTLTEQVRTAILGTVNKCEVNGVLFRAALLETLRSFIDDGLIPTNDSVVDPAGDLVPDLGKSIRTTIDRVTVV